MNEYLNRVARPTQTVNRGGADAPQSPTPAPAAGGKKPKKPLNIVKIVVTVLLASIAILLVALIIYSATVGSGRTISSQIKKDQYQAIFLNSADGQVYFGKLAEFNRDYYKLTDIYYVRVNQVQPDKNTTSTQQNISLAKLGSEIHGPEDVMYVNRDAVMFWENLKEDGQVVKAIREYQKNPTPPAGGDTKSTN